MGPWVLIIKSWYYADVGPIVVPSHLSDEQVLFLSDIFPTAWMAAEHCEIKPEDTIAIWGCGSVGILAVKCCLMIGAKRVISIDTVPERLALDHQAGAETLDYADGDLQERLLEMTGGRGPDAVIEAVGMKSHGASTIASVISTVMSHTVRLERPFALNQAIMACRPCGIVSLPGGFAGQTGPIDIGAFMEKSLTMQTGPTHVQRYLKPLLERIENGEIDLSFIISHRANSLEDGPELYKTFRDKKHGCTKVVLRPHG